MGLERDALPRAARFEKLNFFNSLVPPILLEMNRNNLSVSISSLSPGIFNVYDIINLYNKRCYK